jgi:hypothetical protein
MPTAPKKNILIFVKLGISKKKLSGTIENFRIKNCRSKGPVTAKGTQKVIRHGLLY